MLDDLKARLKKEFRQDWLKAGVVALIEDSEAGRALAELAESTIPIGWTYVYQPMEVLRQDLETMLRSRARQRRSFRLTRMGPGARELAQALDAKIEGGMYDALAFVFSRPKRMSNFPATISR